MALLELEITEIFEKWHAKLRDRVALGLISERLARIKRGCFGDIMPVDQGISELRIHYGPGYRIYLQERGNKVLLLLCGGDKRTQEKDIQMAKRLAAEWGK